LARRRPRASAGCWHAPANGYGRRPAGARNVSTWSKEDFPAGDPGVQAGLVVIPQAGIAAAVLAITWGIGSRDAKMVSLPAELVNLCVGLGA
jgi:hypothetical protein